MRWDGLGRNAIGARGVYHLQPGKRDTIGTMWWLHGVGHDGLLFQAIVDGRPFPTATSARTFADELDVALAESQVSGS
jgi:hypothetical protein